MTCCQGINLVTMCGIELICCEHHQVTRFKARHLVRRESTHLGGGQDADMVACEGRNLIGSQGLNLVCPHGGQPSAWNRLYLRRFQRCNLICGQTTELSIGHDADFFGAQGLNLIGRECSQSFRGQVLELVCTQRRQLCAVFVGRAERKRLARRGGLS